MPAFDPVAFDIGTFDATYPTPVLFQVYVAREMQRISAGQGVSWTVSIAQVETTPPRRYPLNPDLVQVALYDPLDTELLALSAMYNQGSGLYGYAYQVGAVATPGAYCGLFKATNGPKVMTSKKMKLFEVI